MTKQVTMAAATAGHAEGGTTLNAFDNALLAAGIGNINLVRVSSILPPEVPVLDLPKIKPGAIVPTAYAAMTSETPGETIAAAVGYAVPDDPAKNGTSDRPSTQVGVLAPANCVTVGRMSLFSTNASLTDGTIPGPLMISGT